MRKITAIKALGVNSSPRRAQALSSGRNMEYQKLTIAEWRWGSLMAGQLKRGRGALGGFVSSVIGLALMTAACAGGTASVAEAAALRTRDCYNTPLPSNVGSLESFSDSDLRAAISTCVSAAQSGREVQAARAWYNAGRAQRILGETRRNPADVETAVQYLTIAVNMGPTFGSSFYGTLDSAKLELARAHRLLGHYNRAEDLIAQVGGDRPAVRYERAMIYLGRDPGAGGVAAYDTLAVFSNSDLYFGEDIDRALIRDGRTRLVQLATALGNASLGDINAPPVRDNAERAIPFYSRAGEAAQQAGWNVEGVDTPEVFYRLGIARLWAAGVPGSGDAGGLACGFGENGGPPETLLISAREAFERTIALERAMGRQLHTADANWGLGCATMAAVRPNDRDRGQEMARAIGYFRAGADGGVRNRLALARAEATIGDWANARANFEAALTALPFGDRQSRSSVQVEIAKIWLQYMPVELAVRQGANTAAALQALNAAVSDDNTNAEAYFLRGQIALFERRYAAAREDLRRAESLSAGPRKAASAYYLSVLETQDRSNGSAVRAVDYADAAFEGDRENPIYRRQACLTRILSGLTAREGRFFCTAVEGRPDYREGLLYEGLFWLREAYVSGGGNQRRDWAQALRVFERGLDIPAGMNESSQLADYLAYGRRFALHCAGLGAANTAAPGDAASDEERQFFARHGLGRCWR